MNNKKEFFLAVSSTNPQVEDPKQKKSVAVPRTSNDMLEDLLHSLLGPDLEDSNFRCSSDSVHSSSLLAWICSMSGIHTLSDLEAPR